VNVSENDRTLLLEFQRALFAFDAFPSVDNAHNAYNDAKDNLKKVVEPAIAELVRRMSQEWTYHETPDSRCLNQERGNNIMLVEKELYEMTFQLGDNLPSETDKIQ
jgi:hypothetical protein